VDLRIRNATRSRNHQRSNGRTHYILKYTKTTNNKNMDSYIPILLSEKYRLLEEEYLINLRPLEEILAYILWGNDARLLYREFLFVRMGQRIDERRWYKRFPTLFKEHYGVDFTVKEYREFAIAVMREFIPPEFRVSSDSNAVGDLAAQHHSTTARRIYSGIQGGLPYLTTDAFYQFNQFCHKWHVISGFGEGIIPQPIKILRALGVPPVTDPVSGVLTADGASNQILERILSKLDSLDNQVQRQNATLSTLLQDLRQEIREDVQTTVAQAITTLHRSQTPSSVYLNPPLKRNANLVSDRMDTSTDWNSFSNPTRTSHVVDVPENWSSLSHIDPNTPDDYPRDFGNMELYGPKMDELTWDNSCNVNSPAAPIQGENEDTSNASLGPMEDEALQALRNALGNQDANWTCQEQRDTVLHTLDASKNVVSVMKTGSGKSMAWIVASLLQDALSLVIVPYRDLLEQHLAKALLMGCKAMQWTTKTGSIGINNLIFVAMETAASPAFGR
jgi:hypothetical protein